MLTEKGVKRVLKEIKEMGLKSPSVRGFSISFQESNLQTIFAIIRSLDGDFDGGEYILKIKLPDNYPFSPPVISCETPNGRFSPSSSICLNISHFHSETWSALITLEKIILSVMSVFYDESISGVGSIRSSSAIKKELAGSSMAYNRRHFPNILENEL
jgi:ubiquitin-protein ligase